MKNSNLIEILKLLSQDEMKELKSFVISPYFNKSESAVLLFEYLRKLHPSFPPEKIEKEKVYAKIFKGAEYNDGFMRKLMHTLFQLAESYLAIKGFTANRTAVYDTVLEQYYTRNSSPLFLKTWKSFASETASASHMSTDDFYYSYLSSYRYLAYGAEHKNVDFIKFAQKNDLLQPFEYLQCHYYSSAMNLYEYYLNAQAMSSVKIDNEYFRIIFEQFDKKIIAKYPYLQIHYNLIKMLVEPDKEEYFFENKKLIYENKANISPADLDNFYINLQNYCMKKIRSNRTEYSGELFGIYKMELANNKYSAENRISLVLFLNIVFTALQLGEIDFAEKFAEEYKEFLPEEGTSNFNYAKAHIALKKGMFEDVGRYLARINKPNEMLKADIKSMYLLMYYETNAVNQFYSVIDTFRHFLKNNSRISEDRKNIYSTFINFITKLISLKEKPDKDKLQNLGEDIKITVNLINKKWLLEKIEELKNI